MKQLFERFKSFYIGPFRYEGAVRREFDRTVANTNIGRTQGALVIVFIIQIVNLIAQQTSHSQLPSSAAYYNFGAWFLIVSCVVFSILLLLFKEDKANTFSFRKSIVIAAWAMLMGGSLFYCYGDFLERQLMTNFTVYMLALGVVPALGGIEFSFIAAVYLAANLALCVSPEYAPVTVRQMLVITVLSAYCSAVGYTDGMRVFNEQKLLSQANRKLETLASSALSEVKEANAEKQDFLSRMSHDMRTPLAGIIGLIDLSIDEQMSDELRSNLVKMEDASKYLLDLMNYTLDLNEAENNRMALYCETVEGDELIFSVLEAFLPTIKQKNITFTLLPEERASMLLRVDKLRVQQLFSNILANAVKFTRPDGHITATIEYPSLDEKTVTLCITVKDDGIGMSENFLPRLYEPFSKESNSLVGEAEGAGLGMSIVKSLVELMHGTIETESELGKGTAVKVTLTFDRAYQHGDEHRISGISPGEMQLRDKRILLVEDHPLNLEIAKRLLERRQCVVECATDGKEGVDMFASAPAGYYDAILMDIHMPIMDGLTAARAIRLMHRSDAKSVPIVAMTANAFEEDEKKSMAAGMNAHLSKPIEPVVLYRTIAELLSVAK